MKTAGCCIKSEKSRTTIENHSKSVDSGKGRIHWILWGTHMKTAVFSAFGDAANPSGLLPCSCWQDTDFGGESIRVYKGMAVVASLRDTPPGP